MRDTERETETETEKERDRERERERQRHKQRETGSMQGAQCGTRSQDDSPEMKERPDLKADFQELAHPKTGDKGRDGPNVKGASFPSIEPIKMPEAGMLPIENAN
ncbi:unnamed protein product [Nyctereutes procyonoides]|uniref:(raccoon dog) hypothetical protein n=1 Tax=Nyctereutes procyonoides TaxID=34880 RepID=A0A811Z062_NYCPR|nr:unnamed protein product [Nyctereutes procyonoides]